LLHGNFPGRRDAPANANHAKAINGGSFDLSAAQIDADAEAGCHRLCTFIGAKRERGYGLLSSILYNPAAKPRRNVGHPERDRTLR